MATRAHGQSARPARAGHNGPVKFRIGIGIGFGVGYALGSRAGGSATSRSCVLPGGVGRSAPVSGTATLVADKTKAVATLGVERMKDAIGVRLGWRDGERAADAIALDLAEDLATALSSHRR